MSPRGEIAFPMGGTKSDISLACQGARGRAVRRPAVALAARPRYMCRKRFMPEGEPIRGPIMRAETKKIVDEIKQSIGLLRRHL